jgi:uncharacterized protein YlaN (UPF0358 family)
MYFEQLSSDSKVWVYQANRPFSELEKGQISDRFKDFVASWAAHGSKLLADATIIDNYFVVLSVEKVAMASGCSIDTSVKFIKQIGLQFNIDFFNRLKLVVQKEGETKMVDFSDLNDYESWNIYNTLVNSVEQLNTSFLIPVKESELFKMIS